ncbi:hypothetical protein C2S52_003838 [Perilla frutescens var. hirtella]|nr:hypothetical protein C2S52_003838 [Perilla frutescens var. hirtella]
MKMKVRPCELCNAEATVFCPSDAAFLCRNCDAKVHEANFLVARHVRRAVCSTCKNLTGDFISGVGRPSAATCPSCPPASADDDLSSTSSSVCISSTTSPAKEYSGGRCSESSSTVTSVKRRPTPKSRVDQLKAEGVFVNWCGKLGVEAGSAVRAACRALKACVDRWTALPFRVCLAASMWLGLRLSLEKPALTWKVLKRLDEISGVPAKIILAAESKLERAVRGGELDHRRRPELEEGWAEC